MVSNERLKISDTFKSEVSPMKQFCSLIPLLRTFFSPNSHVHDLVNTEMLKILLQCSHPKFEWISTNNTSCQIFDCLVIKNNFS